MKTILITGCSSGIGLDAAHTLQERGWKVFATCRRKDDQDKLEAQGFASQLLDYEDPATISAALENILKETDGRLDALFNNGAYGIPSAVEDIPTDALRQIFEANLFGWHELTRKIIPLMRQQGRNGEGRIIQCSSVLGLKAMPWRGAYNATKFALEGLTDTLRLEMRGTGIHISTIQPGPIRTEFRKNAAKQFEKWIDWEKSSLKARYEKSLIPRLYASVEKPDPFELGPEAVTKKLIHALESNRPKAHYYVTTPTYIASFTRRFFPLSLQDNIWSRF